jgi:hypothetical protein
MVQCRGGLSLTLEAGERLRVVRNVFREEFQRDETMETSVFSLIDNAHAATANFFYDAVMRDSLADG